MVNECQQYLFLKFLTYMVTFRGERVVTVKIVGLHLIQVKDL